MTYRVPYIEHYISFRMLSYKEAACEGSSLGFGTALKEYFKRLCAWRKLHVSVILKQYEDAGVVDWQAICHLNLMISLTSLLDRRSAICAHMLYYCYYHWVNEIFTW